MTTKNKIIIIVTTIVLLVVGVVVGRLALNSYIQKQINVVRPTDVTSFTVKSSNFFETIDTFGTAIANQSFAIRIKKADLISSVDFDKNLIIQKNQLIAQLKNDKIMLGQKWVRKNELLKKGQVFATIKLTRYGICK